jgi:polysaccharide export outer membrane protein
MKKKISYYVVFFLLSMAMLLGGHANVVEAQRSLSSPLFALGPEDILEISVWKDEALTKQVVVRPDGWISFPLIGDIQAADRSVEELRQEIQTRIKAYIPDAPVTVMVMQVGSPKVFVVGKVAKPGVYIMGEPMRVMQVLAMAGGATPFADKNSILIIREENKKQKIYNFDYNKVANGKELEQNIILRPGDTIVVP